MAGTKSLCELALVLALAACSSTSREEMARPGTTTAADAGGDFDLDAALPPPAPMQPAPVDESCGRFGFEFSGAACTSDAECPLWTCPCLDGSAQACNLVLGCATAVSCEAVCAEDGAGSDRFVVRNCASFYAPCSTDADCDENALNPNVPPEDLPPYDVCVVHPGESQGECVVYGQDTPCADDGDCGNGSGHCVTVDDQGRRRCSGGTPGAPCNTDGSCSGDGVHCALRVDAFVGACTGGAPGDPCARDEDCDPELICAGEREHPSCVEPSP